MLQLAPAASRVFKASSASSYVYAREREKKKKLHLLLDMSLRHLVSLFLASLIPALLVGRGVKT